MSSPPAIAPNQAHDTPDTQSHEGFEDSGDGDDEDISVEDDSESPAKELAISPDEAPDKETKETALDKREEHPQQEMVPLEPDGVFVADQTVKTEQQTSEPSIEELAHAEKETVTQTEDPAIQGPSSLKFAAQPSNVPMVTGRSLFCRSIKLTATSLTGTPCTKRSSNAMRNGSAISTRKRLIAT